MRRSCARNLVLSTTESWNAARFSRSSGGVRSWISWRQRSLLLFARMERPRVQIGMTRRFGRMVIQLPSPVERDPLEQGPVERGADDLESRRSPA
jgi:hypothetical protein